jgi:CO/xanthine dehydrogenase Mo-binding subunit
LRKSDRKIAVSFVELERKSNGNGSPHPDGQISLRTPLAKTCGQMQFASDLKLTGMLVGKALFSPYPHCKVNRIDTRKAVATLGVHAVLTSQDIPGRNIFGKTVEDQQFLISDRARTVADALAIVAAETEEAADVALAAIDLDLTPLPAHFDPEQALQPTATPIHKDGNLLFDFQIIHGDAESALRNADIIIENDYYFPWIEHAFLETESVLAAPGDNGSITVWLGCHNIYNERSQLAKAFGWPEERFRVILFPAGGSFGGKDDNIIAVWAALLANRTRRPVRFIFNRRESIRGHSKRHSQRIHHKLGSSREGRLVAAEVRVLLDTGAYAHWGENILRFACLQSTGPYRIPAARVTSKVVYTNNITAGAMRGWGTPGVEFAMESQMDILADSLHVHPISLRWMNALIDGDETITGRPLPHGSRYKETLEAAAKTAGILLPNN